MHCPPLRAASISSPEPVVFCQIAPAWYLVIELFLTHILSCGFLKGLLLSSTLLILYKNLLVIFNNLCLHKWHCILPYPSTTEVPYVQSALTPRTVILKIKGPSMGHTNLISFNANTQSLHTLLTILVPKKRTSQN